MELHKKHDIRNYGQKSPASLFTTSQLGASNFSVFRGQLNNYDVKYIWNTEDILSYWRCLFNLSLCSYGVDPYNMEHGDSESLGIRVPAEESSQAPDHSCPEQS